MTHMIKAKDDTLTEELVASLIGKCVHARYRCKDVYITITKRSRRTD